MADQADYDVGTAAALDLIQTTLEHAKIPGFIRGMIPVEREPEVAARFAQVVIDAVDADRAKRGNA